MLSKHSSKMPIILDKVASLTTIRDIDIFESSFIKTLADMLNVNDISLYKFNSFNEPHSLIRYALEEGYIENDQQVDESTEISIDNIDIPDEIKAARDWIDSTGKVYTAKQDGKFVIVSPIFGLNNIVAYLSVKLDHELSDSEHLIISSLLRISQNFHSLLEENQKDKLTGLLNRKTFDDNIAKIQNILNSGFQEAPYLGDEKRHNSDHGEYWLGMIDIDLFKRINDTFGHVYGDEVLLMLSQVMKKTFRPNDLLFRFGGEEFIAIVRVENKQEAEQAFERFRLAIEAFRFPQVGQVTVSLGATLIAEQHAVASDIVGRADDALYYAKENGRNRLFFYEDLVSEGVFTEKVDNGGEIELF